MKNNQAFTLIELLVIIAIVGILVGLIVISLGNARETANDARRKADINQLVKAVMIYKTDNTDTSLPIANACSIGNDCPAELSTVLGDASELTDPNSTKYYTYSSDGTDFVINADLSDNDNYYFDSSTGAYNTVSSEPPVPGNGICGSSDEGNFYDAPTEDLCTVGTPSEVTGTGPWTWDCTGTGTSSCSANLKSDGVCGTADNKEYSFGDSGYGDDTICAMGIPENMPDFPEPGGNSSWSCNGSFDGLTVFCSESKSGLLGYSKRKSVTITSSANLTDYQVKLTVPYDSDMQADFDDLRFANSDDTVLPYWIESKVNSSSAVVWIKTNLTSGNNNIYMYYENSAAVSASSGNDTFSFFDGFDGSAVDTTKWNDQSSGLAVVSGGILSMVSNVDSFRALQTKTSFSSGYSLIFRVKSLHTATEYWERMYLTGGTEIGIDYSRYSNMQYYIWDGTLYSTPIIGWSANTWGRQEIRLNSSNVNFLVNGGNTVTMSSGYTSTPKSLLLVTSGNGAAIYFDWMLVRKYVANEPTILGWGNEEG
jgi:type II secretory pathway pseudopilin PulG